MADIQIGAPVYIDGQQGTIIAINPRDKSMVGIEFTSNGGWFPYPVYQVIQAPSSAPE